MEARTRARQLRRAATIPEQRLWSALSARKLACARFNRQVPIAGYIVDFVARTPRLVIEVDGDTHAHQRAQDAQRTAVLLSLGYEVLRFTNAEVMSNLEGVCHSIAVALAALPSPNPSRQREGS